MESCSSAKARQAFVSQSVSVLWHRKRLSQQRKAVDELFVSQRLWHHYDDTSVKRGRRRKTIVLARRESARSTSADESSAKIPSGELPSSADSASATKPSCGPIAQASSSSSSPGDHPKIVVIGPPGSGKTTLTEQLRKVYGLVRVGCGDMLRAHVLYGTKLGRDAKPYMDAHELVPDEIVIPMVLERLRQRDCGEHGWVLDGFPRTIAQATALRTFLGTVSCPRENVELPHSGMVDSGPLGVIILLEASDERLLERVRHRRIDPETHTVYNMKFYPPEEEEITERLLHIPADEPEAFRRRLAQFRASLPALLAYITEAAKEVRNDSNGDAHLIRLDVSRPGVRERFLELEERLWRGKGLRRLSEWQEDSFRDTAMVPHASMSFARARAAGLLNRADMAALSAWSDEVAQVTENGDLMDTGSQQVPTGLERSSRNPSRTADDAATIKASSHADERAPSTGGTMDSSPASSAQRDAVPTSDGMGPRVAGPAAGDRQTKKPQTKASITLIRCDGVQCVRETVHHGDIAFHGSATEQVMLRWNERPRTVLLLVKKGAHLSDVAKQAVDYLQNVEMLQVLVEPWVQTELFALGTYVDSFHHAHELHSNVDLVVCLGGDGLILYASTLFRTAVPPVAPFNLGSLGFLTPFEWKDFPDHIRAILSSDLMLSLRMRLMATVVRASGNVERQFHVLNEVVVDRGASPFLCQLECFWDDEPLASVQADGIIVASPTGSTAYSLAAGGAMVHPSVPAICVTPVCPHSLGLRPLVLPDSARIRVKVSPEARSHAWASFDGKHRLQLRRGDSLIVEMSKYPMPTVNATDHAADWFGSLIRGFGFNVRGAKPKPRLLGRSDTAEQPPRKGIEAKDE